MKLLDPKLDIVFKLLLQREQVLLRSMIETVVTLDAPIENLEILNPEIPRELAADKGIFLDVRVSLANHGKINIEMQSELPSGIRPGPQSRDTKRRQRAVRRLAVEEAQQFAPGLRK